MIRRFFRMQANQPTNSQPTSDFQRLLAGLNEWWTLVARQLDKDFTNIQEQISAIPVATSKSQTFTAGGTFTAPHDGWYDVYMHGGGGGSGGVASTLSRTASSGAGAGQEVGFREYLLAGEAIVFVIGALGTAGTTAPTNGGNGGDTTATIGSTVYRARGGLGSAGVNNTGASALYGAIGRGGHTIPDTTASRNAQIIAGGAIEGANGAAANTTLSGGACGSFSGGTSGTTLSGGGAASSLGAGGNGATVNGSGSPGQGFGSGGGGSLRTTTGSAAGADGAPGRAVVSWIG